MISQLLHRTVYELSKKDLLFLGDDIIVRGFLERSYLLTSTNLKQGTGLAQKAAEKGFVYIKWLPNVPFQCNGGSPLAKRVLGSCRGVRGHLWVHGGPGAARPAAADGRTAPPFPPMEPGAPG